MQQFCEMSSIFEVDNVKNEAILRDFLNFQVGKIKNEAILRDFLQKWKVECRADCLLPMRFAMFPLHLSKVLRLPRKSDARSYEVLHLSRKNHLPQRWRSDAPKCNLSQEISALISYSIYLMCLLHYAYHAKCIFLDPLQMSHACHRFWNCHKTLMFCSLLTRCTIPCACHAKRHLNVQKRSVPHSFWHYWLRNVLRATTACTFWTSQTSKSGPSMVCFVHFDLDMCFAPQRRALFRHLNFQMWSDPGVLCTFWLCNVLRATTACNFSSLIWPAGSAPAALASLLFDPPEPQIIGKTQCFATFLPFRAPGSPFFWKFLLVDLLSSSLLFSDSSHLCVSSVHIVGSLSSKLRSMMRSSWVCFRTEAVTRHQGSACVDSGGGCKLAQYGSAQGLGEPLWEINGKIMKWKPHVFDTSTWQSHKLTWCFSVSRAGRGKRGDGDKG